MTIQEVFGIEVRERGPHIPAYAYQWASPVFFGSAFKFSVVRNPWDRLVSAFHFLKSSRWPDDRAWSEKHLADFDTFEAFLAALERPLFRNLVLSQVHFHPQVDFIADPKGRVLIDRVIYFERLADGLRRVAERLQLEAPEDKLSRLNASAHLDYRDCYDDRGREIVGQMYARDAELLGYRFEGLPTRQEMSRYAVAAPDERSFSVSRRAARSARRSRALTPPA